MKQWSVVVEEHGKQVQQIVDAQQLRIDDGCLIFILDGAVEWAYSADVWITVRRKA